MGLPGELMNPTTHRGWARGMIRRILLDYLMEIPENFLRNTSN